MVSDHSFVTLCVFTGQKCVKMKEVNLHDVIVDSNMDSAF